METTGIIGIIWGLYRDYWGYIRGYIGIMEKKMETTTMGLYRDSIRVILGLYGGNGK